MISKAPSLKNSGVRLKRLFLSIGVLLVVGVGASYFTGRWALAAAGKVRAHDVILEDLQAVLSEVQDAETGQRGYLLTHQQAYLRPYEDAMGEIDKRLSALRSLVAEDSLPADEVKLIDDGIARKMRELRTTVYLFESGRDEEAVNIVKGDEGRRQMDEIRAEIGKLRAQQQEYRTSAEQDLRVAFMVRDGVFFGTVAINLAFLLWAYRRIRREIDLQYVAALEIQRQQEILAVTLSSIGDAVIITDTKSRVTFLNAVAEELTGWSAADAVGSPCSEVFHIVNESSRKPMESPVDKVLRQGKIAGLANHTLLIRKDGMEMPIDDSGAPIREEDGTIRGVVLIFRDFTTHKAHEKMLIDAKNEVEAASLAKDKFLAALSHELRTPLTPVMATLSSWDLQRSVPEDLRPELLLLRRNIELEARLIDDLLDLTRLDNGRLFLERELLDAHVLIEAVAALLRDERAKKEISLDLRLLAGRHFIEADPGRLQQVVWNILGNAVKFTAHGGRIEVATSDTSDGRLEIVIRDNGLGMSEETMSRIFQRFEQGGLPPDRNTQGLGLGLSIARGLIEAHNGTLTATSAGSNQGSSFVISLPTVEAPAARVSAVSSSDGSSAPKEKLNILLLEDHPDTAAVMASVLSSMGHTVKVSATVAEGCASLREGEFDVLLSDLGLPDGSGLDFIREARKTCRTPAIALTGYGMAEDIKKCIKAGFDEHLTKPIDFERLQKVLKRVAAKG
ncbi:hypothetical protein BH09VER1_BH09VER1_35000 [soil metagenome]